MFPTTNDLNDWIVQRMFTAVENEELLFISECTIK